MLLQVDAVTSGFRLLEKHGGFFLADVVGLGKTMIATLIAKKFFFYNGFPEHRSHTLIVVPPAMEDSWRETAKEQFRLDNCDTGVMRDMFARGTIYIAPNLNVTQFLVEGREEELIAKIAERQPTDPTIEICAPSDFQSGFFEGLEEDWKKLEELYGDWREVDEDPKLDEFLDRLEKELFDPKLNRQSKLIVFSESEETTAYLLGKLAHAGYKRVFTISSKNRQERMPMVRANFDANFPEKADDYDILISTEVLAEGVNLHRANIVVNYDTPWNSTRLMQRVGRVNRIGATAPKG